MVNKRLQLLPRQSIIGRLFVRFPDLGPRVAIRLMSIKSLIQSVTFVKKLTIMSFGFSRWMVILVLLVLTTSLHGSEQVQTVQNSIGFSSEGLNFTAQSQVLLGQATCKDLVACSTSSNSVYSGGINVLLVFSRCVEDSVLSSVDAWARDMKRIVKDAVKYDVLNFQATVVPGACTSKATTTPSTATGTTSVVGAISSITSSITSSVTSTAIGTTSQETSDLSRLKAFPGLGQVQSLASAKSSCNSQTTVLSFATDDTSYDAMVSLESMVKVTNLINFHTSNSTDSCEGKENNCIKFKVDDDIFLYNPFTLTKALNCKNLDNGVPVTLIGDDGKRQCFCGCPAGYEMQKKLFRQVCVPVADASICLWSRTSGYKYEVASKSSTCSLDHVVDKGCIPMPLQTSGSLFLADSSLDPRMSICATRVQDPEYNGDYLSNVLGGTSWSWPQLFKNVVAKASSCAALNAMVPGNVDFPIHNAARMWKDYQSNRGDALNNLIFSDYGKYKLELNAFDYYSSTKCTGCLAVVDMFRPRSTAKCPSTFSDSVSTSGASAGKAVLTVDNVVKAHALIMKYFDFGDKVENDGFGADNRCDLRQFNKRNFFETKYTEYSHEQSTICFDPNVVPGDFLNHAKATVNPLKRSDGRCDDLQAPITTGQCTRCCKMTTALKEYWTDYRCGSDYDARYCEGDSTQTCTFEQCLVINGDTLAQATIQIKPSIVAESETVIRSLSQEGYQTITQVHRMLACTSFYGNDGVCVYKAKLSELIDTTQALNFEGNYNVNNYVYWRYKVTGDPQKWQLWKTRLKTSSETGCHGTSCVPVYVDDNVLTFTDPETEITIEAWTQCGLVNSFVLYVELHVNSPVDICSQFSDMWYQTSVSKLPITAQMCAYSGSDFADMTFDFHPRAGLQYSRTTLPVKVSEVACNGTLEARSPAQILNVTEDSPTNVTRFAVEMLNNPNTEPLTNFAVSCNFKYVDYVGVARTKTCGRSFSIVDCSAPKLEWAKSKCHYNACAGSMTAGLYEVCGGRVVRSNDTKTYVELGNKQCCQGCVDTPVVCTALFSVSDASPDLMRCEPPSGSGAYRYYNSAVMIAQSAHDHYVAVLTLSGVVVAAVAALITVRRREFTLRATPIEDESYYELL